MEANRKIKLFNTGIEYSTSVVCEYLIDDRAGFRFVLSADSEGQLLQFSFDIPLAYRKIDEGDFLKTLSEIPKGERGLVYEVLESDFIAWYKQETLGVTLDRTVRHFIFLSQNDCIEVLSDGDSPEVKLILREKLALNITL